MDLLAPSDLLSEGIVVSFSSILSLLKGWIFLNWGGGGSPSQSGSQKTTDQQHQQKSKICWFGVFLIIKTFKNKKA